MSFFQMSFFSRRGENYFVASTKRFFSTASAKRNCCVDYFTYSGDNCKCRGNNVVVTIEILYHNISFQMRL